MNFRLLASAVFALGAFTVAAAAQSHPLKEGTYVCRNQGAINGSFQVTSKSSYVDSNGRQGAYQYDAGLNVINLDTGKQYFIGKPDLLILIENGQFTKQGCVRQTG